MKASPVTIALRHARARQKWADAGPTHWPQSVRDVAFDAYLVAYATATRHARRKFGARMDELTEVIRLQYGALMLAQQKILDLERRLGNETNPT